jgi:hypothetical protein
LPPACGDSRRLNRDRRSISPSFLAGLLSIVIVI